MKKWEIFLTKLIENPNKKEHHDRAEEISSLLNKLEIYPFHPKKTFLNIKNGYDFARDEIRGACQRYIYGQYQDSILYSCFSIEMGLIAKLDELMSDEEKNNIIHNNKPLTLYNLIKKSLDYNILNNKNEQYGYQLLEIRNIHIHAVNLISPLISSYQRIASNFNLSELDEMTFNEKLKMFDVFLPGFSEGIHNKYDVQDILLAYDLVSKLPNFNWAANQNYLKLIEDEVEEIMMNMAVALFGGDSESINDLFNSYVLRKRSLEALRLAELILSEINII